MSTTSQLLAELVIECRRIADALAPMDTDVVPEDTPAPKQTEADPFADVDRTTLRSFTPQEIEASLEALHAEGYLQRE